MKKSTLFVTGIILILFLTGCTQSTPKISTPPVEALSADLTDTPKVTLPMAVTKSPSPISDIYTPTTIVSTTSSNATQTSPQSEDMEPSQTPTAIETKPALRYWKFYPVIPEVSDNVVEIYQRGLELGNDPHAYSKIGDCGSTPAWFLGDFDRGSDFYDLGDYQDLNTVVKIFQGSHGRTSLAARSGFNASSLFVTLWADRKLCDSDETPLLCEQRIHKPSFVFIMLGTNDIYHPEDFEPQMRNIIEFFLENGVIPILSTKADNEEGDHSINATIARLAYEYDIPLWNYWLAIQELPNHGLQEDGVHLTWGRNFFDDPNAMEKAWPIRNLTALQVLDKVWRKAAGVIQ